jgi:hypothetical protein
MSSNANPIKNLGPSPGSRKPLGSASLPTVYLAANLGVVVVVNQESGGSTRMTLDEAESRGYLSLIRECDNLYGVVSSIAIQIKSNRLRLAIYALPPV